LGQRGKLYFFHLQCISDWPIKLATNPSLTTLSSLLDADPSLTASSEDDHDHDDDEDHKRRKEVFRYIAGKVLQYHGLPKAYTAQELAENVTIATALKADDGSFGGLHRRIRIEKTLIPPGKFDPSFCYHAC